MAYISIEKNGNFFYLPLDKPPRIFAPEKLGSGFPTDVVFLLLYRERIVSQHPLDKSLYYIVVKELLLSSIIQRAWTKYLGILQEVIISYKKHEEKLCGDSGKV
jgi:hypothetical protein